MSSLSCAAMTRVFNSEFITPREPLLISANTSSISNVERQLNVRSVELRHLSQAETNAKTLLISVNVSACFTCVFVVKFAFTTLPLRSVMLIVSFPSAVSEGFACILHPSQTFFWMICLTSALHRSSKVAVSLNRCIFDNRLSALLAITARDQMRTTSRQQI